MTREEIERLLAVADSMAEMFAAGAEATGETKVLEFNGAHLRSLGSDVQALAAALRSMLPEEREGMCFCPAGWMHYISGHWCEIVQEPPDGSPNPYPRDWTHCHRCGAELVADGIARRHPDAARVERVRAELDASHGARGSEDYRDGITTTVLNIRAALDGPQGGGKDE